MLYTVYMLVKWKKYGIVIDEISCLNACIACQNNNWAFTADFRTYTNTKKAINGMVLFGTIKTTSFKCSCEQPNRGSGNFLMFAWILGTMKMV